MPKILKQTIAPLLSLCILVLGHGLFTTFLPVRIHLEGETSWMVGAITAAYSAGLMVGSFNIEPFIVRVGHIRAYATLAALLTTVTLIQSLFYSPLWWLLLRFIGGCCLAGLFIAIESWLLASSTNNTRGRVLAFYMTTFYAAQASGQYLLNLSSPKSSFLFSLTAILCAVSIIPISMSYTESPKIEKPSSLNLFKLYKISPTGVIGCFSSGLLLGTVYGLVPLFAAQIGYTITDISIIMSTIIFGAMLLQYPIGKLSDHFNRRNVLIVISFLTAISALCVILFPYHFKLLIFTLSFIFGGFAFTLYSLCISHSCDYLEPKDIVAANQGLLVSYGIGAIIGPLVAPLFMRLLGPSGLFIYFIIIPTVLGFFIIWRTTQRVAPTVEEQQNFVAMPPPTTPVANELDTRSEAPQQKM